MANIIITGYKGFVGCNLVAYLKQEFTIKEFSRQDFSNPLLQITPDINTIIHLAGKAHDLKKVSQPDEYYTVNFQLTKKLYDAFLTSDAKQFIFISSVKAVADSVKGELTEDTPPNPQTHYGKSKLMAEEYIIKQPLPPGKSYFILRPCMIHGPGNKGNLNLLYRFVKKGIPYPLAAFENSRSFLSVQNLCFIIKEIITRNDIAGGVYQVADDEPLSTNQVVSVLSASLNKKPRLLKISPRLISYLAKAGDFLHLPLTTEKLDKLIEDYVVSNKKIKKVINKPLPLSAKEGLKITAASFYSA